MKTILIKFCAFCLIFFNLSALGQTNLSIIDSLVDDAVHEILKNKNEFNQSTILQFSELNKEISGYLKFRIGNILTKYNYKVFRNFPGDSSFESTVLSIEKCELIVNYSEPYAESFLGESIVDRFAVLALNGQVYNFLDNKIVIPIKINKHFKDKIKYKQIDAYEESPYSFTKGIKAGLSGWQKIFEPVIVITSVMAVLLLLFTQRS